ncbi:MAG TPA: TonB-dependent receptor [Candidatus Acidoferrales bacterium]|jgi:outer membrane cobalamin receptor|nr:TonB-dependent receptor [Candidatus Acidoferrales bacterium]
MRLYFLLAIAFLLFGSLSHTLDAQQDSPSTSGRTNGTISGTVTDPSGAAIAGAAITAQAIGSSKSEAQTAQSGNEGKFSLTLPAGRYRVSVEYRSFARLEQEFNVTAGEMHEWEAPLALARNSESVIVSDSASPALATNTPDLVDVITREQIEQRQEIWLTDMLASQEGLSFSRLGAYGGITSFFMDGGNSNYTKVLIDGTPANEPGGAFDFSNFTTANIDKIEIVHGATSALYGSDAMDGVIQIFTHRGTTRVPEITLEGDGGTFGTGHGNAAVSGLAGKFDYSGATDYFSTDGQGPGDFFRDVTASGNFGYKFSDTDSLRLTVRNNGSDAGQPGQTLLRGGATPGAFSDIHDFDANLAWNFSVGPHWQNQVSAFESRFFLVENSPPFGSFTSDYNRAGGVLQSTYLFKNGSFTAGYENENEIGPSASRHNQAGYLEARYQFGARLTAIVGGRVEDNGFFGTRTVPRVGAAYALHRRGGVFGATKLRASYGEGIKEPQILPPDCGSALKPEQSATVEAGIDQFFASDRVKFSVTFFHNDFRDIVSFAFGGDSPNCPAFGGNYFNTDKARAAGVNSSFEVKATGWLSIFGNYSYDDSKVLASPNAFDPALEAGNRLFERPLHSANLVANAHFLRMNWNIAGFYVGRRTDSDFLGLGFTSNPSYVRWDLSNSFDLGHGFSTVAHFVNLFDRHYQEAIGYPALGYNYRLGLKYMWGGEK